MQVRKATAADARKLAGILGRAFKGDPPMEWITRQDARNDWARENTFYTIHTLLFQRYDMAYLADDAAGAAIWAPPGAHTATNTLPLGRQVRFLRSALRSSGLARARRALDIDRMMTRNHPHEPHFYLWAIGVEPGRQGRGVGSALIREVTRRCDAERMPAYLETGKEINVTLYERHGFAVTRKEHLPRGGPPLWFMWREPRTPQPLNRQDAESAEKDREDWEFLAQFHA